MIARLTIRGAAVLALAGLAGCNFAPVYHRPAMNVPPAYQDAEPASAGAWKPAQPNDAANRGPWWTIYGDAELNALESRVESANQNIAAAVARYDESRAAVENANSALFPTITGNANATREQNS